MKSRETQRKKRKLHIRKKVFGTQAKPRIFVKKTNRYIYACIANDEKGVVLKSFRSVKGLKGANEAGSKLSTWMKDNKIKQYVFDRSGYKFCGMLKEIVNEIDKK